MNHNTKFFRALITAVLGSALLFGCDDDDEDVVLPDGEVVSFDDVDVDGDGFIDIDEWNAYYNTWDVDNDGDIEEAEWVLATPFDTVDVDGDGIIDEDEYEDAFVLLDDDNDDQLGVDEVLFD